MKRFFTFLFSLIIIFSFSQTRQEIALYKNKFFLYPTIGTDSALVYVNKVFSSKEPIDLAFAYTAKRQLLTVTNSNFNDKEYVNHINNFLKKVSPTDKNNYKDLSNIYNILGNTDKTNLKNIEALKNFIKAHEFAQKNKDIQQIIKVKGNIATIKTNLKRTDEAITETKEVLLLLEKNKRLYAEDYYPILYENNFSNLGLLYLNKFISNPTNHKKYADSALANFNTLLKATKNVNLTATTYLKIGALYEHQSKYKTANDYYFKSLKIYDSLKSKEYIDQLKYNIASTYYESNDFKNSKKYFLDFTRTLEKDSIINNEYIFSQNFLSSIYLKENKKDSAQYYSNLFIELYEKKNAHEKNDLATLYKELHKKDINDEVIHLKEKIDNHERNILFWIIISCLILAVLSGIIYYQIKTKKRAIANFHKIIEQYEENNNIENITVSNSPVISKQQIILTDENEKKIQDGLTKLEKEKYFLKQEYDQYSVAKKIGTNTSYLSSFINKHKEVSFGDYTNQLRVDHIVNELIENKKLRNYTIQSLAEMTGYKNGTSFSRIFKSLKGITPYQFIEQLNKE
ncbi:AraC family transcriptional regulator [Chryseobacterium ginsengisoli]|uniref:AraC family transcriptional regulator n=1 Tax=Chryseobacterium ginsengisoli TaxID=363853 RepID=UPI0031E91A5D